MQNITVARKRVGVRTLVAMLIFTPTWLATQAADPLLDPIEELPSCVVNFDEYRENMESCSPYKCAFPDIFFSGYPIREIIGQEGEFCAYSQEIPWGYTAICLLDEETQAGILNEAEFLANLNRRSASENLTTRTEMEASLDGGSVKVFLGEEEIFFPPNGLNHAINLDYCEVRRLP